MDNNNGNPADLVIKTVMDTETVPDASSSKPMERSSINVIFTDWVPAETTDETVDGQSYSIDQMTEGSFMPSFEGSRPRYFQIPSGKGKIRPGLGSNPEQIIQKKRKRPPSESNLSKRLKISQTQPPCAVLHEFNPDLQYEFEEVKTEGSKSMPSFTCTVVYPPIIGSTFAGEGRSKKLAKNNAAKKILQSLGYIVPNEEEEEVQSSHSPNMDVAPNPPFAGIGNLMPNVRHPVWDEQCDVDFTSDDILNPGFSGGSAPPSLMLSQPMVDGTVLRRLRNIPNFEDNVCLALNTIAFPAAVEYESLGEEGPPHDRIFTIKVKFNNMQAYIGTGGSKKKAKADAAKKALISVLGFDCYMTLATSSLRQMPLSDVSVNNEFPQIQSQGKAKRKKRKKPSDSFDDPTIPSTESSMEVEAEFDNDDWGEYDLNFSDFVCNSVREKYEELMGTDPNYSSFKVLAGIVMTTGSPMMFNSKVIAVTTGTKCVEGDFMSDAGLSVNDCHAEILATRCLRDFLYSQIELYECNKSLPPPKDGKNDCILEANTNPASHFKYQLKFDVKFHLYISTSPCGDARIFSPKGIELEDDQAITPADLEDTHPNKLNRGVLRSKIEAGEGTIPSANLYQGPQTWDAIVSGNALYTMSCSDKVCRWNVLGMQGALLYNLLGSIYYSSITLGSLHHPVHFKRAVYGRVEPLNSLLDMPFHVSKPKLMMVSREEKRRVKKSPNHAVCWSINWSTPEILAANKGRCEPGGVASRLTKRLQFARFLKLYNNLTGKRENYVDLSYHEAKQEAADYQKAKNEFVNFFKDSNMGRWIGKPMEQDDFKIK